MERRILLVDDDMAVLLTLKAVLELNQFEVQTSASAKEAMEKLENGTYQMVITDARMETEDAGFHGLRAARRAPAGLQSSYRIAHCVSTAQVRR